MKPRAGPRFEAILFDFDGVIVDSEQIANEALAEVLTEAGYGIEGEEAVRLYAGLRWADCCRLVEQESGLRFDAETLGQAVDRRIEARMSDILAIEGVGEFVAAQCHRRLAIASSSEVAWLRAFLAQVGLEGWFGDRLYSAAGLENGKPHPEIYLRAARGLGVEPEHCLVVEDHPVGVAAGAAAGMTVIALLAGSHIRDGHETRVREAGAHHVARDYREVAEILAGLEAK